MIKTKKQMMILIGSFILILFLGTTTYAFFNYIRTGVSNTIKVGRIAFNTVQGPAINLVNVFPIDKTNVDSDTDNVGSVTIHVTGDTSYSGGIEYLVTAVDVNNTIGTGNNTKTIPISITVTYDETENKVIGESDKEYFENRGGNTSLYKILAGKQISEGNKLLVGYIKPDANGIDGTITIKAFLDKDNIAISDTYPQGAHSETIGEDHYGPNPNMTNDELQKCIISFANTTPQTYTLNSNLSQSQINYCVTRLASYSAYLDNGSTMNDFCSGTGTVNNMTITNIIEYGYLQKAEFIDLVNEGVVVPGTNYSIVENFCLGTGTIQNKTFEELINSSTMNPTMLSALKADNIVIQTSYAVTNSWVDGTTEEWANGRTVLTTDEWNSLQESGVSFKVKVEANEGIWVEKQGNAMGTFPSTILTSSVKNTIKEVYFNNMTESQIDTRYNAATIKGDITANNEGNVRFWLEPDTIDNTKNIMYVASDGTTFLTYGGSLLSYLDNVEKIEFNNVDTSRVEVMTHMFSYDPKLTSIDISSFDMNNVRNVASMFRNDTSLTSLDLSNLGGNNLETVTFIVTGCTNLEELNMQNFNFGSVISLDSFLYYINNLTTVNLSGANMPNVVTFDNMFLGDANLETVNLSNIYAPQVTEMYSMFSGCQKLENVYLTNFNTSNVTDMHDMFKECISLTTLDLGSFDTSNVTNMAGMFTMASGNSLSGYTLLNNNLTTIYVSDLWDVDSVTYSLDMFLNCTSLVGGVNTGYNSSNIEVGYAHIDGGGTNPGYLTDIADKPSP